MRDAEKLRLKCLQSAQAAACGDREQQYGGMEDCFAAIATLWGVYLKNTITARDVAAMMVLLKVARLTGGNTEGNQDSWVDIAGYAACGYEIDKSTDAHEAEAPREDEDHICPNCGGRMMELEESGTSKYRLFKCVICKQDWARQRE